MFGEGSLFEGIVGLAILMASIVIHENAHGVVALWLGDDTAKKMGRLTLNPIKHLDIVGSIIIPAALYFSGLPMFGYAKPVPVVPSKLRGTDRGGFATVAAAGPLSNFILAFIAALAFRGLKPVPGSLLFTIISFALIWNITLAAFNLLPIPPLDGSRFLRLFVSEQGRRRLDQIEPYGFLILFGLLFFLEEPLFKVVDLIQNFLLKLLPI